MAKDTKAQEQTGMDEREIVDTDVEDALERRFQLAGELAPMKRAYRNADKAAKAHLDRLALGDDEAVRIGRFRIKNRLVKGRDVAFVAEDRNQYDIKAAS